MAKTKKTDKPEEVEDGDQLVTTNSILKSFLSTHKKEHYNFEPAYDYKVSFGSMIMDCELEGGLGPGLHRFTGISEGGKTSAALEVAKNFLNTIEGGRGIYVKAEGRLSKKVQERSGVKFVFSEEEWVDGTMFVLECNIYEAACECINNFIFNNPEKKKFIFIIDSVDGLISRGDIDKGYDESNKVAGGAVIASNFMKRVSIPLSKRGHMAIFMSQVRSDIKIDPNAKSPVKLFNTSTGGNALVHFSNYIFDFKKRWNDDLITFDPTAKTIDPKTNPIIGHWAKVEFIKSENEKSGMTYRYPICHNRTGGKSIWIEKEIVDMLLVWQLLEKKGGWFNFNEEIYALLTEKFGPDVKLKIQGINNVFSYLESNPEMIEFLRKYLTKLINGV